MRRATIFLALLSSYACGSAAPTTGPSGESTTSAVFGEWGRGPVVPEPSARMEGGFFVADGAPAPGACTADADCMGDTVPAEGGCCQDPTTMGAYARAYWSWIGTWRGAHCSGVECPPPPNPDPPSACYFEVHCAAGVCANTCRF